MLTSAQPKNQQQGIRRRCPDCGAPLIKRSSSSEHVLMSKTFLVCKSAVCGATFAGVDEITHRLSPPSWPNPEIQLPYAPSAIRRGVLKELGLNADSEKPLPTPLSRADQEARL